MSYENYRKDQMDGTVKNLLSNDFFSFNYYDASEATNTSIGDYIGTWSMMSYFGRLNYNYDENISLRPMFVMMVVLVWHQINVGKRSLLFLLLGV